jgi:hypothetical protein
VTAKIMLREANMRRALLLSAAIALQVAPALAQEPVRRGEVSPFTLMNREPPAPPQRPDDLLSYAPDAPARDVTLPRAEAEAACASLLADANLVTSVRPAIAGEGGCGIAAPVSLLAVVLQDKRRIEIAPAPVMRCDLAARVGAYIRETVAPVAEAYGRQIKRVVTADSYDCRGRNRQAGARLSEHATGGAIDLSAIEFADGSVLRLADKANDASVAAALKDSACARFSTVLGPGSDGYHEDHVHLDLAQRRNGYKICQWSLK